MSGIGLDSETTGVDIHHGARPFLVTICDEEYNNTYWEWRVNPLTREVIVPKVDVEEIAHAILTADFVVLQNAKFDIGAMTPIMPADFKWPYDKIHDTTYTAHLINSGEAKDLTSLALDYLEIDIQLYEENVEAAVNKCRTLVRRKSSPISNWMIAKKGLPCMPSAKDKCWKYDMWLPLQVTDWVMQNSRLDLIPEGAEQEWPTLTAQYANTDSATCLAIFKAHQKIIVERDLLKLYEARRELIPCVVSMEQHGATVSGQRYQQRKPEFEAINAKAAATCKSIAADYDYRLELPKGGKNNSLSTFVFDVLGVEATQVGKKKTKTDAPSLDKNHLKYYLETSPPRSKRLRFLQNLATKRAADTALGFMESYEKFWKPLLEDFYTIHSSLNVTGSNTLRFTSSNPNEQQISKREGFNLRYLFGPAPGREWWSLDAKNIELRIPAYESGEAALIDLFERPDEPPYYGSTHLLNFSTIYPDIWEAELREVGIEKVGKHCKTKYEASWYQWCKNFGFAVQYGAQDRDDGEGTADIAAHKPGAHALVKSRFNNLEGLNRKWIDFANTHGYIETMPDHSVDPKQGYPLVCTRNRWGGVKPTIPLSYHVQGTAMWWMCRAMVRCQRQLEAWGNDRYRMVFQIHDELVFDFPVGRTKEPWKANLPKVRQLARLMAQGGEDIGVPTPVGIEYHSNNFAESQVIA